TAEAFLAGETHSITHVELTFTEILVVQMAHENPAMHPYCSLFDNGALRSTTPYDALLEGLEEWFDTQPAGPDSGLTLFHLLREPFLHNPDSLKEQLEYIKLRWHAWLPPEMLKRLLVAQDALREETLMRGFGPGPVDALSFDTQDYDEPEAFSRDEDWMPRVVLVAKLAYVWLDQLSIKYGRTLTRLDDIPNEELDQMAQWGFNALWLIGVWERSPASSDIKQRMGNPEAAASAYSLYDYDIAVELGGEKAYQDLAHRAEQRGIRLAGDMVPNHVGLYSRWVIEHPDWFVQLHEPPFPGYKFTGPDLSREKGISLFIEDGYWDHSDAAVVFKHVDTHTGTVRYLYHGNDGTSMPWNDTAQLNFTLPEVREAVIKAIIHVARMFPIIRFDAAMTLAKRHYQRLWFPRPGEGGAIPSRAEYGIDKAAFDDVFPMEFWREVVDRIAVEAPDTLLLAEAFWLMEGYFVRTLGMHRVYNSAFMNMLKEEDNANYRKTLKNVLEFSPAILQRFVNFMNNPDEDTAQEQFGKDDKYFGVAAMLVTMPGLPMFGHGQIEGFTEKYGMEYRRAYYQETPDKNLIDRHKREIFPLMRKRYLFSDATNFALFDFTTAEGWVNENVYAYTNRTFDEQALIVYNNAYDTTQGVLHTSTAINEGNAEEPQLQRRTLTDALALNTDPRYYAILRDERSGLEYLRHNATIAEAGLHFELDAYEYKAFITIRQVCDNDRTWGRLHALLGSKGVPDMEEAYIEMYLSDILNPFRELMKIEMVDHVLTTTDMDNILGPWRTKMSEFLTAISDFTKQPRIAETILEEMTSGLQKLRTFMTAPTLETLPETV
ncbi:MAG: alpha-amylase, partial [Candidatus Hydrogenedentes bacterium]|nr:alpha-amylase [Candidatus Hydrogenedentota bacterium]